MPDPFMLAKQVQRSRMVMREENAPAQLTAQRVETAQNGIGRVRFVGPLECLARVLVHIPDQGQVTTRDYGWYANRPRGIPFRDAARRASAGVVLWVWISRIRRVGPRGSGCRQGPP